MSPVAAGTIEIPDSLGIAFDHGAFEPESRRARFGASSNGKQLVEVEDSTFTDAEMAGLWTKADSVTLFDQVTYGGTK